MTRLILPASNCDNMGEMLSTMKAHYRLSPSVFIGGWLHRHPFPICTKIPDFLEESRCNINYIVCTSSLGQEWGTFGPWAI